MKKNTAALVALFNSHPNVGAFHTTSDGFSFPQLSDAEAHARSLEDKTIESVDRADNEKAALDNVTDVEGAEDAPKAGAAEAAKPATKKATAAKK